MSNVATKSQKESLSTMWQLSLAFVLAAAVMVLPDIANATASGTNTPIGNIYCIVVGWMTGNTGKGIATIAVTIIGIGALLGKVSWGMALIVGLGVAVVFGAGGIINALDVDGVATTCATDAGWQMP